VTRQLVASEGDTRANVLALGGGRQPGACELGPDGHSASSGAAHGPQCCAASNLACERSRPACAGYARFEPG
jgi:hypothetical protein